MEIGVEEEDKKHTWMEDAEWFIEEKAYECARAIYAFTLNKFPKKKGIWARAAAFEKEYGSVESYENLLAKATQNCPNAEDLWLMYAKSRWMGNDVAGSRSSLAQAFENNPNSEKIWMAAVKLESENQEFERARRLLGKARESAPNPRFWMKSARLEWCLNELDKAIEFLAEGIKLYPDFEKFYMMWGKFILIKKFIFLGQILTQENKLDEARKKYTEGLRIRPKCIPLWILLVRLEEERGRVTKARSDMDVAKKENPKNEELWLEAVRLEIRAGQIERAQALLAIGLQECSRLWAEAIFLEQRHSRRTKSMDALKHCEHDPHVLLAGAKLLWAERKVPKARNWFQRTVKLASDFGDAWAYFYKFELVHGQDAEQEEVKKRCRMAEPRHGEIWQKFSKDITNWRRKTEEILVLVAMSLEIPK